MMNGINKKFIFLSFMFLIIFSISIVLGDDININTCWSKNLTSNNKYILTSDIIQTNNASCLSPLNTMSNVEINCNGYTIDNNFVNAGYYAGIQIDEFNGYGRSDNITVRDCYIRDFGWSGIDLRNTSNVHIINNTFDNNGNSGAISYTSQLSSGSTTERTIKTNWIIEDNHFINPSNNAQISSGVSVALQDIENVIIRNNYFNGTWNGTYYMGGYIQIDSFASRDIYNFSIYNNEFENLGAGKTYQGRQAIGTYIQNTNYQFTNFEIYNNTFKNIINGIMLNYIDNLNIYNNSVIGFQEGVDGNVGIFVRESNNTKVYDNYISGITKDSKWHGNIAYYLRETNNAEMYNNIVDDYFGVGFRSRNSNNNVTIYNNIATNPNITYGDFSIGVDIRNAEGVEVYGHNIISNDNKTICINIRDTSPNNYVHDNICSNGLSGVEFREGGTYTNNIITNNTFTNNDVGVQFNDLGEILDLSSNNIYSNDVNVQSGTALVLAGNYYVDGDVNSSEGLCEVQPYTEGNVTDNSAYCCLNGFNDGCSYTPDGITGYVASYTEGDIAKSSINIIVKIVLVISSLVTFFVVIFLIKITRKHKLIRG